MDVKRCVTVICKDVDSYALTALANGKVTLFDPVDAPYVSLFLWSENTGGYAKRKVRLGGRQRTILLHRKVAEEAGVVASPFLTDHQNLNKLDNRRSNLRAATRPQNGQNSQLTSRNTSGFKGVSFQKSRKWRADIRCKGKSIFLGLFDTREEAYAAYCEASPKYHGEFGRTK